MTNEEVLELIQQNLALKSSQLDLSGQGLTELPPEIGHLQHLQRLNLKDNKLTELPPQIGYLTKLQRMYLSKNKLVSLPAQIGCLTELQIIYLGDNKLESLPPEIGNLVNLQGLYLSDNNLTALPAELQNLTNLKNLDLRKNSLGIPSEVIDLIHQPSSIMKYYFEYKAQGNQGNKGVKIIILGTQGAGKTSLANRLVGKPLDLNPEPTATINVYSTPFDLAGEHIQLEVVDLGGRENLSYFYQSTFSPQAIYLLITEVSRPTREIEYWLKIVTRLAPEADIIILGNKTDLSIGDKIDQSLWQIDKSRLFKISRKIKSFLEISCHTGVGLEQLQDLLVQSLKSSPLLSYQVSANWLSIKNQITNSPTTLYTFEDFQRLCRKELILEDKEQRSLADFLANTGTVVYPKNHPQLKDDNLCKSDWFISSFDQILNNPELSAQEDGRVSVSKIQQLFNLETLEQTDYFTQLLKRLDLAFTLGKNDTLVIPSLFSKEVPATGDWTESTEASYHYNYLPETVIIRIVVRLRHLLVMEQCWRDGGVIQDQSDRALIKVDYPQKIITVQIKASSETAPAFWQQISDVIDKVNNTTPGLEVVSKSIPHFPSATDEIEAENLVSGAEAPKPNKSPNKNLIYIGLAVGALLLVLLLSLLF